LKNQLSDSQTENKKIIEQIQNALGGDEDTSLLVQIQKLRAEQNDYSKETKKDIEFIVKSMNENNELISKKFDEFSELLAKTIRKHLLM
jgi:vacuolar-type H+-ATPase subunit H